MTDTKTLNGEALKIVRTAREILTPARAWTKGTYVRNDKRAPGGHSFCATGAMQVASGERNPNGVRYSRYDLVKTSSIRRTARGLAMTAFRRATGDSPEAFNDAHTKREVLAALDETAAFLEANVDRPHPTWKGKGRIG